MMPRDDGATVRDYRGHDRLRYNVGIKIKQMTRPSRAACDRFTRLGTSVKRPHPLARWMRCPSLILISVATLVAGFAGQVCAAPPDPIQPPPGDTLPLVGSTINNAGGTIQAIDGTTIVIQASTITGGTVQTVGTGMINLGGDTEISGGALTNSFGGTINAAGSNNVVAGAVSNAGAIRIGVGSLTLLGTGGSTDINSGTIAIGPAIGPAVGPAVGGASSSLILVGNVSLNGGGSVVLAGSGSNRIIGDGASVLTNVDNTISGSGEIGGGSVRFVNQGSLISDHVNGLLITGGALGYTNSGLFKVNVGASLTGSGVFTNFANSTLTGGNYQVFGTFTFDNAAIHTNAATILLGGPAASIVDQDGHDALAAFSANAATGNFTIRDGHNLTTPSDFSNAGIFTIGASTTFHVGTASAADYTQSRGTTTVNGSLAVANAFINSGTLTGSGTVIGNVFNSGTISHFGVPATFSITGNYVQSASGTLNLTINGTGTGLYDRLIVGGSATFDGILNVNFGYAAVVGDTLQVILFASGSGFFDPAHIHVTGLADNLTVFEFYNNRNLTLFVGPVSPNGQNTPEPTSIVLLALGLAGLGVYRIRKHWSGKADPGRD
jgi:hypothetical protein